MGSQAPRGPRALTICLATSAGAHVLGALLALLVARPLPSQDVLSEEAIVVDLLEPAPAPPAALATDSAAPAPRDERLDPSRLAPHSAERRRAAATRDLQRRGARSTDATLPGPGGTSRGKPSPPAPTGLTLAMRSPTPVLDLRLSVPRDEIPRPEPRGSGASAGRGNGRGGAGGPSHTEQDRRIKQQLDRLLAEDQAARDTRAGKVPPVVLEIMRDADKVFAPPWRMIEDDARKRGTVGATARSMLRGWFRSYLAGLKAYRGVGAPLPGDRQRDEPAMLSGYAELLRAAAKGADSLECEVCVDLVPGQPPRVHVARRSGRPSFDRMAADALALAARLREHGGPPRIHSAGGGGRQGRPKPVAQEPDAKAVEACYRFVAKFHRVPPLPTVMCSFDESKPSISCIYPMKKIVSKGVRLVIVRVKKSS